MTKNTKESDAGRVRETNFMHGRPNPIDVVIGMVTSEAHSAPVKLIPSLVAGMDEYFPQYSWTLVHASSSGLWQPTCAPDGYVKNLVAVQAPRFGVHRVTYPWHDVPAKTNGFRAILEFAQRTCAKVCLIADPAQAGFERRWVDSLVRPGIHSKYDLVTPVYSNGSREHLISGNLLSPLMKALFGHGPKQPMPGCAGSTATLAIVSEQAAKYLVNLILILLPNLALAFAIIMAAWCLGSYWSRATLIQMTNEGVPAPWRWAAAVKISIVAAGIALACESTGFATTLVRGSFLILLAGGTYAAAQAVIPIFRAHLEEQLLPGRGKMHNPIDDRVLR